MLTYNAIEKISSASYLSTTGVEFTDEDLRKPSREEIAKNAVRTATALATVIDKAIAKAQPTHIAKKDPKDPVYVMYKPNQQSEGSMQRVIRIREVAEDPMAPTRFKVVENARRPPSPPPVVLHTPPRKLTDEERANWDIPPALSNWVNPRGHIIPLDKRAAFDGRALQDNQLSDKFAKVTEALFIAERSARTHVAQRAQLLAKIQEKERLAEEARLSELAAKVQQGTTGATVEDDDDDVDPEEVAERERIRRERRYEIEREARRLRGRTGEEREYAEKLALGQGGGQSSSTQQSGGFDENLFARDSGHRSTGMANDDDYDLYDKPLFTATASLYRPSKSEDTLSSALHEDENLDKLLKDAARLRPDRGFAGTEDGSVGRSGGPVQFEKAVKEKSFGQDSPVSKSRYSDDRDDRGSDSSRRYSRRRDYSNSRSRSRSRTPSRSRSRSPRRRR